MEKAHPSTSTSDDKEGMKPISMGPWGGKGGNKWDDGVYTGIRQIILVIGNVIDSINIEYDNNGSPFWLEHGGSGGNKVEKIQLDYPKEILTSISGYYENNNYLRSLTFESNSKKYGPYGVENGTYFSSPLSKGKILGFYGRSGWYLDCIGVHLLEGMTPISVGPWGGKGGNIWDDRVYTGIRQIILIRGDAIDSINIEYDNNGSFFWLEHGGSGGNKFEKIQLDYPKEILTSISGYYNNYLRSLTFQSNLKKYGPYGVENGTYFSSPLSEGKILGFYGRSGWYLDCIGVHLLKDMKPISVGPWGGKGGNIWNDGVYTGIRQIILVFGNVIDSINIEYDNNGSFYWLEHGGSGGNKVEKIQLDYPKEILTSISGYYDNCLRSLTFESNSKKYGPYGVQHGTYFSSPLGKGKILGFHGRSSLYLDCIGVHLLEGMKYISVGPWGGQGGKIWDDGVYTGIRQIILVIGNAIDSINIEYDNNGSPFWLEHGGSGGKKVEKIRLDYPKEILTSISGHYNDCLRSLTFKSNSKKYGPYGVENGTYFSSPLSKGKILGFYGRSGWYLDCIGVHLAEVSKYEAL